MLDSMQILLMERKFSVYCFVIVAFACHIAAYHSKLRTSRHCTWTAMMSSSVPKSLISKLNKRSQLKSEKAKGAWWNTQDVHFSCSGCGKCCLNEGSVWLNVDECADLCFHLDEPIQSVADKYFSDYMPGWAKLKNVQVQSKDEGVTRDGCVFLDDEGKKCTIYEARPIQCRTYPWWPRLLLNESAYSNEAVTPDFIAEGRHWSAAEGGCEGINNVMVESHESKQSSVEIHRNKNLYEEYIDTFPFLSSNNDDDAKEHLDRDRLLDKVNLIQAVRDSTRAWVKDFVVKYELCPFAEKVFVEDKVRYRVYFGGSRDTNDLMNMVEKVKFEILDLLANKEQDVATTLLMLPFAFQTFPEWHEFTMQLEDEIMPILERETGLEKHKVKRRSLLQRSGEKKDGNKCPHIQQHAESGISHPDIQLAFFHPLFSWADSNDLNDPLNFEKRAPFPTINLLRAQRVRDWADEKKTSDIAENNISSLETAENLSEEFEAIIRIALGGSK